MSRCDLDGDHDWEAQWVCEDCGERKAFDFEQEANLAQKLAQARAALLEMTNLMQRSIRSNGVGAGSYHVGKWDGQLAIHKARAALAEPKSCECAATVHAPQCPYARAALAEQEGRQ